MPKAPKSAVAAYPGLYRELRDRLPPGTVVHPDHVDPALRVRGVVARDRSAAVWTVTSVRGPEEVLAPRLRLPGLDPDRVYVVRVRDDVGRARLGGWCTPAWIGDGPIEAGGRVLTEVGLQLPSLQPVQSIVVHVTEAPSRA
jgi:alpha-galactosidase